MPAVQSINCQGIPGVSALGPSEVENFLLTSPCFRVVEDAGSLVGYLIAFPFDAAYDGEEFLWFKRSFDRFVYIDQVAVAQERRGKGAASALYADLEAFARGRQIPLLACEVNLRPENKPSLAFHTRQGFLEVGRLETRQGRLVSLMLKHLGSVNG